MRKIIPVIIVFVIFLSALSACAGAGTDSNSTKDAGKISPLNTSASGKDIGDASDIYEKISSKIALDSKMPKLESNRLTSFYDIKIDDIETFVAYLPASPAFVSEIAVFEFKDEAKAKAARQAVVNRAEKVMADFKTYIPAQFEIAKKYVIIIKGKYLFYVMHENSQTAAEEFEKLFR